MCSCGGGQRSEVHLSCIPCLFLQCSFTLKCVMPSVSCRGQHSPSSRYGPIYFTRIQTHTHVAQGHNGWRPYCSTVAPRICRVHTWLQSTAVVFAFSESAVLLCLSLHDVVRRVCTKTKNSPGTVTQYWLWGGGFYCDHRMTSDHGLIFFFFPPQDENMVSFIKGGMKVRNSYMIYK